MMGFGSNDNYSGYMGGTGSGGGTNYAPPGGSGLPAYSSDSSTLNPGATKWGTQQQTTASSTQYKPMGNFEEKSSSSSKHVTTVTKEVVKVEVKNKDKKSKRKQSSPSSSSSSSESEDDQKKKKTKGDGAIKAPV